MASIAIPIISAALPLLQPLIKSLILHVESLFGSGTGSQKLQTVINSVTPIVESLTASGKIPGSIDGVSIGTMIETVVQAMNSQGVLNGSVTPAPNATAGKSGPLTVTGTLTLS